jgi:hypothetical protein
MYAADLTQFGGVKANDRRAECTGRGHPLEGRLQEIKTFLEISFFILSFELAKSDVKL